MNKKLGAKILIPILLILFILWYQLVFVATRDKINDLNAQRDEIETNMIVEQAKNTKMRNMQKELETLKNQEAVTEIAAYDNIQNVMNSLNTILAAADDYNLAFQTPVKDEESGLYRRNVSMQFSTNSFSAATQIIRQLYQSPYRCVIDTMSLQANDSTGNNNGILSISEDGIKVSMEIVYYEIKID